MRQGLFRWAVGAALAASAWTPSMAALLNFQLSGSRSATFQLDSNPVPDSFSSSILGMQVQFLNVAGSYDGAPGVASSITFGTGPILFQLDISGTSLGFTQFAGPDLFTGPAAMPTFSPGTFSLVSFVSGASQLIISPAPSIPEPVSWAMMVAGFGVTGAIMRRRRGARVSAA